MGMFPPHGNLGKQSPHPPPGRFDLGKRGPRGRRAAAAGWGMTHPRTAALVLACLTLPCLAASAATWNGAGDGWSWSNPDNWEGGALPEGGGAIWIKPVAGSGWVEIGGVADGALINLVIDSPINLNLLLNPEARVAGVTTLDAGTHRLGGQAPGATSSWEVAVGGTVILSSLPAGASVEKRGGGTLAMEGAATGAGGLRVAGLEGSVILEVAEPLALADATLEATGASFSFAGGPTRAARLVIGEGQLGPMTGGRLVADEVVIRRAGTLDLSYIPGITAGVLRLEGGGARLGPSLETGRIVVRNATLELGESTVGGVIEVGAGWMDGGTLTGELALDAGAGMSGWMGAARMEAGSRLTWKPVTAEAAAFYVFGELTFAEGSLLEIGAGDWDNPFWDDERTFAFIDTWSGGVVRGAPQMEGGRIDGRGGWSVGADAEGGLALMWSPEARPVPEGSAAGWALAFGMAAGAWRRRRGVGRERHW